MKFEKLAYIPYLCCGYPTKEKTIEIAIELEKNGADALELGIPFSDPIADGPTIQKASNIALKHCKGVKEVLEIAKELRKNNFKIPIVIMSYYNPIYKFGIEKFCIDAKEAGIQAVAIPDLPLEESEDLRNNLEKNGLEIVYFIALTTPKERMEKICEKTTGFVYVVSVKGTTGERKELEKETKEVIERVKKISSVPVILGFGISNEKQVKEAVEMGADGVIIGSKLITIYKENGIEGVIKFSREIEGVFKNISPL